jgi:hypothetical protein
MSLDAFTVNAIIVVLLLAVLLLVVMLKSSRDSGARLQALEQRLRTTPSAPPGEPVGKGGRELCGAIHRLYPNARVGLDFQVRREAQGYVISEWLLPSPQPTSVELATAMDAYRKEQASQAYRDARTPEYPSIGDQLDALYKARQGDTSELAAIDALIREVKARHPKPGEC